MLTVIDGGGESAHEKRTVQLNGAGLVEISTIKTSLLAEPKEFKMALRTLNFNAKKRLYRGLQKDIAICFKKSVKLLKIKRELLNKGDDRGALKVCNQYKDLCHRERLLLDQIKKLYKILNAV